MWEFAGDTAPANWMLCQGQVISRATYAALFAIVGVRFGAGDGSTTFAIPDMRGCYPFGHNAGGTYGQVGVGQRFGNKDSTLPTHQHGGVDHLHPFSGGTGGATARHTHGFPEGFFFHQTANPQFYVHVTGGGGFDIASDIFNFASWGTTNDQQDHGHAFSGTTGAADRPLTTGVAGGDATNANLPPSVSLNYIIRVS
jgi:microcystin-dependent protein